MACDWLAKVYNIGFKKYPKIEAIQNKAIRIFLDVHQYAPLAAINGDMGWTQSNVRHHVSMIRFWNRVVNMDNHRLPNIVLKWDLQHTGKTWSSEIKTIFNDIGKEDAFVNLQPVSTNIAWALLHEKYCNDWKYIVNNKPKLRTYKEFKTHYQTEQYVISFMSRKHRSYFAQLRCGILPLQIETGRWYGEKYEERICKLCNNDVETELHFIFQCPKFTPERIAFYHNVNCLCDDFLQVNDSEKLALCMTKPIVNIFSKYLVQIYEIRKSVLFN